MAAGVIEWDEGETTLEDPSYGMLRFYIKSWGKDMPYAEKFHEVGSHLCAPTELNDINGTNSGVSFFYETSRNSDYDI